jgi:hypothetical protein
MLACGEAARYPQPDCTRCPRWRQLRGQAALFPSHSCTTVHVIIRRDAPDTSMLQHLFCRIERNPRIVV